jgi:hypothetical protein
MNYAKPTLTLIDSAKAAIQSAYPKQGISADSNPPMGTYVTVNAYEADE